MDLQTTYKNICLPKTLYENYIEDKLQQDLIIPDYYCLAQKIVHCEASAVILNKSIADDKIILEGMCTWKILYLSEEDSSLHHISCERSFTEIFSAPAVSGSIRYKIKTKNVLCKLQSASRADCKATLCIAVKIEGEESKKILAGTSSNDVQLNEIATKHYELKAHCEKEFRVTGELQLKRRQEYDVYKTVSEVILRECKCYDGKAVLKGISKNTVILISKESCDAESAEIETNFTQVIESDEICEGWYPCVHCTVSEADASFSGNEDEDILMVSTNIMADISVYTPQNISIFTDAYHLKNELKCQSDEIEFYRDIQNVEVLTHISQKAHLNTKDMSVLYFESHADIEKIDVHDSVMVIDGKLIVECVYSVNDGVFYNTFSFPFQSTRKLEENFQRLKCEAEAAVNNFSFIILSDTELEISCDCRISMTVYTLDLYKGIVDMQLAEQKDLRILQTPLVLYYGSKGENLWEICKKYSVPINAIKNNNDLVDKLLPDDRLIFISKH